MDLAGSGYGVVGVGDATADDQDVRTQLDELRHGCRRDASGDRDAGVLAACPHGGKVFQRGAALGLLVDAGVDPEAGDAHGFEFRHATGDVWDADHVDEDVAAIPLGRFEAALDCQGVGDAEHRAVVGSRFEGLCCLEVPGVHEFETIMNTTAALAA